MTWLDNLKITRLIWLVAGIGLFIALLFSSTGIWRNLNVSSQMERSSALVSFSVSLSDLVHELQKERGASAVFLTDKGRSFGSEMRSQRAVTD